MSGKTPEQIAADNRLDDAVQEVARAYNLIAPEAIMLDFIVIGEAMRPNDENSTCDMFIEYRSGDMRLTTVLGMIEMGKQTILDNTAGDWSSEDDG